MGRKQLTTAAPNRSLMPLSSEHFVDHLMGTWTLNRLPTQLTPSPWKPSLHRHPRIGLQIAFGWQSTPIQESSAGDMDIKTHTRREKLYNVGTARDTTMSSKQTISPPSLPTENQRIQFLCYPRQYCKRGREEVLSIRQRLGFLPRVTVKFRSLFKFSQVALSKIVAAFSFRLGLLCEITVNHKWLTPFMRRTYMNRASRYFYSEKQAKQMQDLTTPNATSMIPGCRVINVI